MNSFFQHLPWRVASLAGLMVGAISLASGVDVWACLLRVCAAFVVFGAFGLGLRSVLQQSESVTPPKTSAHPPPADHRGQRFDQTTPEPELDQSEATDPADSGELS